MELTEEKLKEIETITPGRSAIYRVAGEKIETLYVSPELPAMNGMTEEEYAAVTSGNAAGIVCPADLPGLMTEVQKCIRTGRQLDFHYRVLHKVRGFDWVHAYARLCGTLEGDPVLLVLYANASSEADIYQNLLNHSENMIYVCDRKTRELLYVNENARHSYGVGKGFYAGEKCYAYMWGRTEPCENCILERSGKRVGEKRFDPETKKWLQIDGERILWCGREAEVHYISDITAGEMLQHAYRQSMKELFTANPDALCAFHMNLTRNLCSPGQGKSAFLRESLKAESAEEFFHHVAALIPKEEERKHFLSVYSCAGLLSAFESGKTKFCVEYHRRDEKGRRINARSYLNMLRNPETGDVEAIVYSVDFTRTERYNQIFHILTDRNYEEVALVDAISGRAEVLHQSDTLRARQNLFDAGSGPADYDAVRREFAGVCTLADPKEDFFEKTSLASVCEMLRKDGICEVTVFEHLKEAPEKTFIHRLRFYFLDEERKDILLLSGDVTADYESRQKELSKARAQTERMSALMNSIKAGVAELRMSQGKLSVDFFNRQMFRILGYKDAAVPQRMEEAKGTPAEKQFSDAMAFVHPEDRTAVMQAFRSHSDEPEFSLEPYRMQKNDGTYCWIAQDVLVRERKADSCTYYATYRDVTKELSLRHQLEKRIEEEESLRQQANAANQAKSDFISRISHDMRTPLNGIIGMTYLAEKEDPSEKVKDCLDKIDMSSKFLLGLINDVLDMSKAESSRIELHPELYPVEAFDSYLDAVIAPLCRDKKMQLVRDFKTLPDYVPLLDRLRINQIMFNLLSNAIKYSPEGSTVICRIREEILWNGRMAMTLETEDSGIGISEKFQKILFDPFTQEGRNDSSASRGSGLGLAITKKLADAMGGTISVRSRLGKGSVFTVKIVQDCVPSCSLSKENKEADPEDENIAGLSGKHILLCEDHPLNQEIALALLKEKNMVVQTAEDGRQAVAMFSKTGIGYYDCILMDIRMPVMDGMEATRTIRRLPRADAAKVPIVAMTADAFADDVRKCIAAGMNDHIAKPINPEEMYRILNRVMSGRKKRQ